MVLHRIINPLADQSTLNKYPVLYGHGVLYDSRNMISRSLNSRPRKPVIGRPTIDYTEDDGTDDKSLPFMFSNNNFDVWLFDARATNRHMRADKNLSEAQKTWDFSLDDEALIDLPLLIEFVLARTASRKLMYVGYSQSTLFMFALLSSKPDYADKIAAFIALAPVAYVANIKGLTLPLLGSMDAFIPDSFNYNFVPQPIIDTADISLQTACADKRISNAICAPIIRAIGGVGSSEMAPEFFRNFIKGTSAKVVKHFVQLFTQKRFGMYDFGSQRNMKIYGSPTPPPYRLKNIKSDRIILVRGLSDFLSTPEDQSRLIMEMGRKPYLDIVIPQYNHFDFIDGKDLVRLVNGPIMMAVYELLYSEGPNILKDPFSRPLPLQPNQILSYISSEDRVSPIEQTPGKAQVGNPRLDLLTIPKMIQRMTDSGSPFNILGMATAQFLHG